MNDPLIQLLDSPELNELIRLALEIELRQDPAAFYKNHVAPRSSKLVEQLGNIGFAELTPAEEVALMDEVTARLGHPPRKEGIDAGLETITV